MPDSVSSQRENHQQPNKTVLTPHSGHDIPAAINSPGSRQGHGLCMGLKAQEQQVLTCRRPPSTESAGWADPLTLIRSHDAKPNRSIRRLGDDNHSADGVVGG